LAPVVEAMISTTQGQQVGQVGVQAQIGGFIVPITASTGWQFGHVDRDEAAPRLP